MIVQLDNIYEKIKPFYIILYLVKICILHVNPVNIHADSCNFGLMLLYR